MDLVRFPNVEPLDWQAMMSDILSVDVATGEEIAEWVEDQETGRKRPLADRIEDSVF